LSLLLFTFLADSSRLYQPWRGKRLRHELGWLILLTTLTIGSVGGAVELLRILPEHVHSAKLYTAWLLFALIPLGLLRLIIRPALMHLRRHGINQRRVLIAGMSEMMENYVAELMHHPEFGFQFEGYVDDREAMRTSQGISSAIKRLGSTSEIDQLVERHSIDQVWLGYPVAASHRTLPVIDALKHQSVVIRQVMDAVSFPENGSSITSILNRPVLDIDLTMTDGELGNLAKSTMDRVFAALILAAISPLMLVIAVAVKLSSPGPVLHRQTRLTWRNRPFEMLKFRSMPVDIERDTGPCWARPGENRATRVGAFLRVTSLDELPQFWNVIRGEMSIVGPRPERPEFVQQFKNEIPNYMKKHRVKAGITGWAQVNGYRGDTDLSKRIEYDLHYIRNSSLLFDLQIILLTLFKGFVHRNAY
jgi:putative colanic acid biosynthesis UDP-glucose lipid carrier transferase